MADDGRALSSGCAGMGRLKLRGGGTKMRGAYSPPTRHTQSSTLCLSVCCLMRRRRLQHSHGHSARDSTGPQAYLSAARHHIQAAEARLNELRVCRCAQPLRCTPAVCVFDCDAICIYTQYCIYLIWRGLFRDFSEKIGA